MPQSERPTRIDQTDAKAGSKEGVVRWVLAISLGLTVLAFAIIVISGALSQDPIESQQNAQRRAEEQREAADESRRSSIDGVGLAEEQGMIAPGSPDRPETPEARATGVAPNAE